MKFSDIKQTTQARYSVNVSWDDLSNHIERYQTTYYFDIDPNFQRDHKWNTQEKIRYIEYILKGGISGKEIYINQRGWMNTFEGKMVLVDGKQRINAVFEFMNDKFKVFGNYYSEFEGYLPSHAEFIFSINNLKTIKEVYQWYIDLNDTGVSHTKEEINKVKNLIKKQGKYNEKPSY